MMALIHLRFAMKHGRNFNTILDPDEQKSLGTYIVTNTT